MTQRRLAGAGILTAVVGQLVNMSLAPTDPERLLALLDEPWVLMVCGAALLLFGLSTWQGIVLFRKRGKEEDGTASMWLFLSLSFTFAIPILATYFELMAWEDFLALMGVSGILSLTATWFLNVLLLFSLLAAACATNTVAKGQKSEP